MSIVDCKKLKREDVLLAMWRASQTASFFTINSIATPSPPTALEIEVEATGYIDYLCGRVIKIDFAEYPLLDACVYDHYCGTGAAQRVVDVLGVH